MAGGLRSLAEMGHRGGEIIQNPPVRQVADPAKHGRHVGQVRRPLAAVEVDGQGE
jgi:hypothetical protein